MEIEIKFNEVFNAPMGSPRPRFRNTGRFVSNLHANVLHKA